MRIQIPVLIKLKSKVEAVSVDSDKRNAVSRIFSLMKFFLMEFYFRLECFGVFPFSFTHFRILAFLPGVRQHRENSLVVIAAGLNEFFIQFHFNNYGDIFENSGFWCSSPVIRLSTPQGENAFELSSFQHSFLAHIL